MDNDYLLGKSSTAIKAQASKLLNGNWKPVSILIFIYLCLDQLIPNVIDLITGPAYVYDYTSQLPETQQEILHLTGQSATLNVYAGSPLYTVLLSGALTLGLCMAMLLFVRKNEIKYSSIFEGFTYFVKALCTLLLIVIKLLLWSLLFILPAIPAAFNYSQALYILADDPSKGPLQCIHESTEMMKGNKMNLFVLGLSFIGWAILLAIVLYIVDLAIVFIAISISPDLAVNEVFLFMLVVINLIPSIFLEAYIITSKTVFYQILHGEYNNEPNLQAPID